MSNLPNDNAQDWTVQDVIQWLDSISLGHKDDLIQKSQWNGQLLLEATAADLQEIGFTGLQCKKILRELQRYKQNQDDGGGGGGSTAAGNNSSDNLLLLQAENASLKQELAELRAMVTSLQKQVTATGGSSSGIDATRRPATTIHVAGFCRQAVIEQGAQTQVLTVSMGPGDVLRAEPGAMVHMSYYIKMDTKTSSGQGLGRLLTGQGLFLNEFTYVGPPGTADTICLTPDFPAEIVPIDLSHYRNKIICQRASLLASGPTINVSVEFTQSLGAGFFGGEGFVLQGLNGTGMVFLNARGTVLKKELRANERLIVATGNLVAFSNGVQYGITNMGGGLKNDLFGGEGFFVR